MAPRTIFPEVPADLSGLTPDELSALETTLQETARRVAANDTELLDGFGPDEIVGAMTDGVTELERVRAELGSRQEGEQAFTDQIDALAAQFGVGEEETPAPAAEAAADEPDEDGDEETDEPEAEASAEAAVETPAPEPVAAAPAVRLRRPPAPRGQHQARIVEDAPTGPTPAPLMATGYVEALVRGRLSRDQFLTAFGEGQRLFNSGSGRDKRVIATAQFEWPEDRMLGSDPDRNYQLIQNLTSEEAIVASGGFCAPYPPLYDLPIVASAARPVRDALATFGTPRGGIQYPTPLGLSDVIDGITVVTAAQDEGGGSDAVKACVTIDCDPFQSAEVEAIAACVEHGNLNARAWPERVANVAQLLAAAHASVAEGELLAALTAGSTNVIDEAKYDAYSTITQGVLKAGAAYRSRHRMDPNARLRAIFPAWVPDLVAASLAHNGFTRLDAAATRTAIEGYLTRANINVSWYMDQDGTTQQVYGTQAGSGAALDEFLTHVVWYLFHEGAWLFLDMGRLDLGLIRDSDLISTNDFKMFYETFEGAAFVGVESLRIDSTVCPNGTTAATSSPFSC